MCFPWRWIIEQLYAHACMHIYLPYVTLFVLWLSSSR
jgi:hypothetical protein